MVGHRGSSAGSYLTDPTSPIPSHCASIVVTSTLRVKRISSTPTKHVNIGQTGKFPKTIVYFTLPIMNNGIKWWRESLDPVLLLI